MQEGLSSSIVAGASCVTINPANDGLILVGYRDRPCSGVALDLCLRAIVFGNEFEKPAAALLVLDTLSTGAGVVAELRKRAALALPSLDPATIMVVATHTHSAPTLDPFRTTQPDAAYLAHVFDAAGPAIKQAWNTRENLTMSVGLAEARLCHNRRVVDPSGKATNDWLDPEARHLGYCNSIVRFLTFCETGTGRIRIVINTYGCHPVVLGPGNTKASADYPGYLVRALEAQTGAHVALHVTGAAANINPRECLFAESERARPMGEAIAQAIVQALPAARNIDATPVSVHTEFVTLTCGPHARENYTLRAQNPEVRTVTAEIQVVRLGEVAMVSAPGELFAEIGTAIENASPFPHTFIMGYSNDSLGYLCTEAAIREGGYEASAPLSEDAERPIFEAARKALHAVAVNFRHPVLMDFR